MKSSAGDGVVSKRRGTECLTVLEVCYERISGLGLRFIGHIERCSMIPGVSTLKLDKLLRIAGSCDHAISRLKCCFCERTAESAGSAGTEPYL